MALDIIVGAQWGDEGKGHITDLMASEVDIVARFSGGDNAGHTVSIGTETYRLHLIPSGVIHRDRFCCLGNGMAVNPEVLLKELDDLASRGINIGPDRLMISAKAHLITPGHVALDGAQEKALKGGAIGTTLRGIGPAYTDKAKRTGLRLELFTDLDSFVRALRLHLEEKNRRLETFFELPTLDIEAVIERYIDYAKRLAPYIGDVSLLIGEAIGEGKRVLAEGAQGTLLDLDHGTYPFVTSSWPTAAGALIGLGVGPMMVRRVVGVAKAFTTRVGAGPFPCEQVDSVATALRGTGERPWDEFGTTTGRPRRVGWLDLNILRYAVRINSLTELALTKLDILSQFEQIPVCVAYKKDGREVKELPTTPGELERCQPVYTYLPGWKEDITKVATYDALPVSAKDYVDFIGDSLDIPVNQVSVGPNRSQVLVRRP